MTPRGILLDIEGTTTPIAFVYDVLFPFARSRIGEYLHQADLENLKREHDEDIRQGQNPPPWSDQPVEYLQWLIDHDRKSTPLKSLQGKIWLEGFERNGMEQS